MRQPLAEKQKTVRIASRRFFSFSIIIFVYRELFQIHGSKLKPDPILHCCQASVGSITHGVFFFRVGEYPLYLLFSQPVQFRIFRRVTEILGKLYVIAPNMFSSSDTQR